MTGYTPDTDYKALFTRIVNIVVTPIAWMLRLPGTLSRRG